MPGIDMLAPNEHLRIKPVARADYGLDHLDPVHGHTAQETDPAVVAAIAVIGALIVVVAAINFMTLMTARASRRAVEAERVRKALGAGRRDLFVQFAGRSAGLCGRGASGGRGDRRDCVAGPEHGAAARDGVRLPGRPGPARNNGARGGGGGPAWRRHPRDGALGVSTCGGAERRLIRQLGRRRAAPGAGGDPVLRHDRSAARGDHNRAADGVRGQRGDSCEAGCGGVAVRVALHSTPKRCGEGRAQGRTRSMFLARRARSHQQRPNVVAHGRQRTTFIRRRRRFRLLRALRSAYSLVAPSPPTIPPTTAPTTPTTPRRSLSTRLRCAPLGSVSPRGDRAAGEAGTSDRDSAQPSPTVPTSSRLVQLLSPSEIVGVVPDFTFGSSATPAIQPSFFFVAQKLDHGSRPWRSTIRLDPAPRERPIPAPHRAGLEGCPATASRYRRCSPASSCCGFTSTPSKAEGAFIAVCALIAVSVACLGLFALSAYTAERRTREIGVRKAMGASSGDILKLLLWQFPGWCRPPT